MLYDFSIYGVVYRCSVVANALSPGDQKVSGSIPPPHPGGGHFLPPDRHRGHHSLQTSEYLGIL